jgi:hypothetical protein
MPAPAGELNSPTASTLEAPSTSAVPKNLMPVGVADQGVRRVATYTMTEQKTPSTPASAAAT